MNAISPHRRLPAAVRSHGFALTLLAALVYLIFRNTGAYPLVFADEWLYSRFARLLPLREAQLPSYLYLGLFRVTNACGDGFLQCARLLNAVLFVAAAPFIYLTARSVLPRQAAGVIALLSILAPVSSYTAYFMPEAMYFFGFWVLTYAVLRVETTPGLGYPLLCGGLLGLLSLVKVHALFLLPALCVFLCWRRRDDGTPWLGAGLVQAGLAAAATLATKVLVACAMVGSAGLDLLGSFYGGHASNSGHGLAHLLTPLLHNLYGHLLTLVLLFAFPGLMLACAASSAAVRVALGRRGRALLLYALLMLGAALAMTVAYTASIADAGPLEASRLHLRYYDFVFPLLWIGAAALAPFGTKLGAGRRWTLAALLAAALLAASQLLLPAFVKSPIDAPELFSMGISSSLFYLLIALELALLALWAGAPRRAARAFVLLLLPLFTLSGAAVMHEVLARARVPNSYDLAGRFAHDFLPAEQRNELSIAGDDQAGLARALFQLDNAAASSIELQAHAAFETEQAPVRKKWLLVIGQHALPDTWRPTLVAPDYALVRLAQSGRRLHLIRFDQAPAGDVLDQLGGMSAPEGWGAWSNANTVTLHFTQALPPHMTLLLNGRAFGPNAGQPFELAVGDARQHFKLPAGAQELFFQFDTDGRQRQISISVPRPTTPQELGMGNDLRRLGIGLISLEVGVADDAATPRDRGQR